MYKHEIENLLTNFEGVNLVKESSGKGGYINIYVNFKSGCNLTIAERGSLLLKIEDKLINDLDNKIRIWHEPLGDKNTLRNFRGVTVS